MLKTDEGYILSRHAKDIKGVVEMSYWVKTASKTVHVVPNKQHVVFFTDLQAQKLLVMLNIHFEKHDYLDFQHRPVLTVYCSSLKQRHDLIQRLKQNGFPVYEEDIKPQDRYLMERRIRGAICFIGECDSTSTHYNQAILKPAKIDSPFNQPDWKVWSVDIETSVTNNTLLSIGVVSKDLAAVFVVSLTPNEDPRCYYFKDEKSLLLAFMRFIRLHNPNIIIGWNVIGFDMAFIDRRCQALGLKPQFGVNGESWSLRSSEKEGKYFITIPGRVVLDGISLLKVGGYHFESYSLNNVSKEILQDQKTLHGSGRWQEIEAMHANDLTKFVDYNIQDCDLVLRIFQKLKLIELQQTRADLTGIPLEQTGGSVASFENLYLPRLHQSGFVGPAWSEGEFQSSPGGFVMSSIPGFYKNVLVLDFKSLYPSIIRTFKIDPLARISQQEPKVEGFLGARFAVADAILPILIDELAQARELAKAQDNSILSYAIKIIMNSFYGVLGSNVCRFYHAELASSITMRGHQILEQTKQWIEAFGGKVIYGDTDSVFVVLDDKFAPHEINQQGKKLCTLINDKWMDYCRTEHQTRSYLELEFETCYERFFMPTIRGQEEGSKKRYAGMSNGALIFKGLEAARSDWTPLARRFQKALFQQVFTDKDPIEFIRDTISRLETGEFDQELIYSKRLSRPIDSYQKVIPPHVRAAKMKEQYNIEQGLGREFHEAKKRIEYFYRRSGVVPYQAGQDLVDIDYDHYIEKQITPIADSILTHFHTSVDNLLSKQLGLI
ncbi:DNA polymerase II [Marinomonas sp. 15G1-11]|uniref:DNA polymerase n=1 Tax=Marinomonas phaeophyticola TaxID=3004091 RepID=A0ABT4JPJ3_9GAMM|nr:DNA polymerase II [Marinomonas sp. 15G1-11]MCZ2720295.1 DNA polymerase II [Marinomonas sp. 15G1-11]